jgi:two-component system response regulator DevR
MMPSPRLIRVLIVDDHDVVRAGLRALLSVASHIEIVAEARTAAEAVTAAQTHCPEVVILDLRLPDGDGAEACQRIKQSVPATRVLVLTSVADNQTVLNLIQAGADGYVLKDVMGVDMVATVEKIAMGESLLDPTTTRGVLDHLRRGDSRKDASQAADPLAVLSAQELRVLAEVARGLTDKEAADALQLSVKTIRNYLDNIFVKLGVNRRSQAAVIYSQSQAGRSRAKSGRRRSNAGED